MRIADRRSTRFGKAFFSLGLRVVAFTNGRRRAFVVPTIDRRDAVVIRRVRLDAVVDPAAEIERWAIDGRRAGDSGDEVQQARLEIGLRAAIDAVVADVRRRDVGSGPFQGDFHVGERSRSEAGWAGTVSARLRQQSDRLDAERLDGERDSAVGAERQRTSVFLQQARLDRVGGRAEERCPKGSGCRFALRFDEAEHDAAAVGFGGLDRGANDVRLIDGKETGPRFGKRAGLLAGDDLGQQRVHRLPAELVGTAFAASRRHGCGSTR